LKNHGKIYLPIQPPAFSVLWGHDLPPETIQSILSF
jgi:hypothetical protein